MKNHRQKYDTTIPWLYRQNKEYLLPEHFRKTIPYSTISAWRNDHFKPYHGSEFSGIKNQSLEWYELFHEREHLQKTVRVLARVWISVADILAPVMQKSKAYGEVFINSIQQLMVIVSKKTACHIARISTAAFDYRIAQIKYRCDLSPFLLCLKRHPLQLTSVETETIKSAFLDPAFSCWPAVSIYYTLLRENRLSISLSTFYKYVRILGLKRSWPKAYKKTKGIESSYPNQYLHVDTTYWELKSGVKAAIVFVSDNFSRAILGWEVALQNGAGNVKTALQKAIIAIHQHHPEYVCPAILVADGGSENHSMTINQLLRKYDKPPIQKVIARKDILFSNSPIEAINKIMKRYLRYHKPESFETLLSLIPKIIQDYMEYRPHGALKGLTPMECYAQKSVSTDYKAQIGQAKVNRIEQNRKTNCKKCR